MRRRYPLGLSDNGQTDGALSPFAGSNTPGPLGTGNDVATNEPGSDSRSRARADHSSSIPSFFMVDGEYYRVCRLEELGHRRRGERVVPPEQAQAIIEWVMARQAENTALMRLLRDAVSRLAGLHEHGVFIMLALQRQPAAAAPPPPPSPVRDRRPPEPAPPREKETAIVDAQAAALKEAAAAGVPFCEECARAAAAEAAATH